MNAREKAEWIQAARKVGEQQRREQTEEAGKYWLLASQAMIAEDTRRRQIREQTDATCKAWAEWAQSLPQPPAKQKHIPMLDYMSTAE
jgi:hypothetical protein